LKLFLETTDPAEVRVSAERKLAEGVSTSLSVGGPALPEICALAPGPVTAGVESADRDGIVQEARALARLGSHVIVRIPLSVDGLKAVTACAAEGIPTHVTQCDSPVQAVLAAKAGARYVSPVAGRASDGAADRTELVRNIVAIYRTYGLPTEVMVASVRSPSNVVDVALAGAAVAAVPLSVLEQVAAGRAAPESGARK
jgi:transaldolase